MAKSNAQRIKDLCDQLEGFERPYGDNEGCAWNGPEIFPYLPPAAQEIVEELEDLARVVMIRQGDCGQEANTRGINGVRKRGCDAYFGPDQNDPSRNVGYIGTHARRIDLSDPQKESGDDPLTV